MNDKSGYPLIFNINNTKISDQNKIAEGFNNFFSGIGLHTSHNVPHTNKCFSSYMPPSFHKTFFLGPVAPSDVSCVVKKMKPKSSSGHDNISTKLMKDTIGNIIEPMTHIINQSLAHGIVPQKMKTAKVIPIHKSADPSLLKKLQAS